MQEKLLTLGGVYILRDFQKGHKYAKNWPPTFFFSKLFIKLLSFQEKKLVIFSLFCKGKDEQIIINSRLDGGWINYLEDVPFKN